MKYVLPFLLLVAVGCGGAGPGAGGGGGSNVYSFRSVGFHLGDDWSGLQGVSADGLWAVGNSGSISGSQGLLWSFAGGRRGSGWVPGYDTDSIVHGVALNGASFVGSSTGVADQRGFRKSSTGPMVTVGMLAGATSSIATSVSRDGSRVFGSCEKPGRDSEGFLWTQSGGTVGLGLPPGGGYYEGPQAINADGTEAAIVRNSGARDFGILTIGGSFSLFPSPPVGSWNFVGGMSANGRFLAATVEVGGEPEAIFWDRTGSPERLGAPPGGAVGSVATGVTDDGTMLVGYYIVAGVHTEAAIWTRATGWRQLQPLLLANGVTSVTDWQLERATGVSADGRVIVGQGWNPNGALEGWVVTIPR